MEEKIIVVQEHCIGKRIDVYLSETIADISRNKLKTMIEEGNILLNKKIVKPSTKLDLNDEISVRHTDSKDVILPQNIDIDIIYEDEDVLVINKPRGMVVHPGNGNLENTLVNALLYHYKDNLSDINEEYRRGIVHRIDKDTSGLLLVAKTNKSHISLSEQLKNHSVKRQYTLICHGIIDEQIVIEKPIGRNRSNRLKYAVVDTGKYAYTTIKPIELYDKFTYCKAILKTGRTHQIRVHLSYINHPIVGDSIYSNYKESIKGQLLHAGVIGFVHPTKNEYMEFEIEEPEIFKKEIARLKKLT